jgi:oligopeptide/dipeptide ABC transporter ATP-binding protein
MAGSGTAHLRRADADLVLRVEHLVVDIPTGRGTVHAVSDVSLDVANGETLGIVGESGCGKSTTGKAIVFAPPPTAGRVVLDGVDLAGLGADGLRAARGRLQMAFQDAPSSLNPRRSIREAVAEPLVVRWLESFPRSAVVRAWERYVPAMLRLWRNPLVHRSARVGATTFVVGLAVWLIGSATGTELAEGTRDGGALATAGNLVMVAGLVGLAPAAAVVGITAAAWVGLSALVPVASVPRQVRIRRGRTAFRSDAEARVRRVLEDVGIDADAVLDRRPHELSGGQAQRVSIARALVLDPEIVICDEPVSALDVSVQAQVLNLLEDLKARYGLSLVFIAHDLAVVKNVADRVVVMYLGKLCEVASPDQLFVLPRHPYTRALIASIPAPDPAVDPRAVPTLSGELPSPIDPPSGCRFRTRCPNARERCAEAEPELRELDAGRHVACHYPVDHDDGGSADGTPVALTGTPGAPMGGSG